MELLIIVERVSFSYYVSSVKIDGTGSNVGGTTERLIEVEYDAGTSKLESNNLYQGITTSKEFSVTVTPGSSINEAIYAIAFKILK